MKTTVAKTWLMPAKQRVVCQEFDFDATALKPREIAVRVEFTAISPGTECALYLALDPNALTPGKWGAYPWRPGYAGVGHVIGLGAAVTEYRLGDRVVGLMPHSSHCVCDVDGWTHRPIPQVKPEHATYTRLISIAMTALQLIENDPLPTIGVWGQGMIGNLTAQVLRRAGGRVIAIDPVAQRRALAQQCGIPETLDPSQPSFADQVQELTRGEGFDITVDVTGQAPTTVGIPAFTRRRGQMVLMTHWRSQPIIDAAPLINTVFEKGIVLRGALETAPGSEPWSNGNEIQRRKYVKIQRQLATGEIHVAPLISHTVKPAQCQEVYESLCFDKANWWGVVVDWRD